MIKKLIQINLKEPDSSSVPAFNYFNYFYFFIIMKSKRKRNKSISQPAIWLLCGRQIKGLPGNPVQVPGSPGAQRLPRVIITAQMLSHLRGESWRVARGCLWEAEIRSRRSVFPPKIRFISISLICVRVDLWINASVFSGPVQYSHSKNSPQASPGLFSSLSFLFSLPFSLPHPLPAREGSKKDAHLLV